MSRDINYCSCGCLYKKNKDLIAIKHGQTHQTKKAYWTEDKKYLLLSISPSDRSASHPLGKQHTQQSAKNLWKKIAMHPHENLMEIKDVCQCSALVIPINGIPLYNAQTTPNWLALQVGWQDYLQESSPLDCEQWCDIMEGLCKGLIHLHGLGIAHGDPYPFNVIIKNNNTPVWIDFGNITDASDYFIKDVYAFVLFTLLFSMSKCSAISASLLEDIANAMTLGDSMEMLIRIQTALSTERHDWDYAYTDQDISESFFSKLTRNRKPSEDCHLNTLYEIALHGNTNYYSAFLHWMRTGKDAEDQLAVEREKFKLYSSEIDRLTIPRYVYNNLSTEKALLEEEKNNWQKKYEEAESHLKQCNEIVQSTVPKQVYSDLLEEKNQIQKDYANLRQQVSAQYIPHEIYDDLLSKYQEISYQHNELTAKHEEVCTWAASQTAKHLEVSQWADYLTERLNQVSADCTHNRFAIKTHLDQIHYVLMSRFFRWWMLIYAFLRKLKNTRMIEKFKLTAKIILRLFGKKYSLGLSDYNPGQHIMSSIRAINEVLSTATIQPIEYPGRNKSSIGWCQEKTDENVSADSILEYVTLPKVTVLLPVYNHAEFIHLAVDSILNQTYNNLELIMLDDGSTDGLTEKVRKYQNDYRFKLYHQPNQKLPMGLSHLHELATGDYVTWTSADNIMEPTMIETLVDELQKRPDAEMIFGDVIIIDENGNPLLDQEYRDFNRDPIMPEILRLPRNAEPLGAECDNYINASFMYRRSASQALGNAYACDLVGLEDYDYWLRMQRCGKIIHAETSQPLYRYRVHRNTMSEELLTAKREQHIKRAEAMIQMEQTRAAWAKERWHLNTECHANLARDLNDTATGISIELSKGDKKNIWIFDSNVVSLGDTNRDAYCICKNGMYHLGRFVDNQWKCFVTIPKGNDIDPLALKARYTKIPSPYYEYQNVGTRIILGCHVDLSKVDINSTLELVQNNPDYYFVFLDTENSTSSQLSQALANQANAVCLGYREFGVPYRMYSTWNGVFIPQMHDIEENCILRYYQLSLMLGKWCVYSHDYAFMNGKLYAFPFGCHYDFNDIATLVKCSVDYNRMDLVLSTMTKSASMERLVRYSNGMMQDFNVMRPDFNVEIPKEIKPSFVPLAYPDAYDMLMKKGARIALAVDTLNQGGMEQVVAMMAYKLRDLGFYVEILCTIKGGKVANQLKSDGIPVTEFNGSSEAMVRHLKANPPQIISSHYLHNCIDVPHKLGIPMVETLHNMFAFFDKETWNEEEKRRKYFDGYIAVSEMVRKYYCTHNKAVDLQDVDVIGNAADPHRISGINKGLFRKVLGLEQTDFVFTYIASFDGRKNHIGLITAFIDAQKKLNVPLKLVLLGNILDETFYNMCCDYIQSSGSQSTIMIIPYRNEIASVLADIDVVLIPSYIEGWSIAATEAQYAGKPLIHTNCGSGFELCGDNEFGILVDNPAGDPLTITQEILYTSMMNPKPSNTEALTEAIIDMYKNRDEWKKKSPMIRSRSIRDFNYDVMIMRYLEVFHRIVTKQSSAEEK